MEIRQYLEDNRQRFIEDLIGWLKIPSISSLSDHAGDMQLAAKQAVALLKSAGIDKAEVRPSEANPVVYGEHLRAPGKPTVLIYGHYDVMPVDPVEQWSSPPFEPVEKDGFLFGRGTADDKGQVAIQLNAVEALLKCGEPPLNFKFLIEGGEEVGSPGLEAYLKQNQQELACDAVVVSDTAMAGIGVPSLCVGLRGLCYLEILLRGPTTDLHSGSYGGAVENPANALAHIVAALKDRDGVIQVPGFYDDVVELSDIDRQAIAAAAMTDAELLKSTGSPVLHGEPGYTPTERIWARPTLDVNGIWSGFIGEGAKTVIPSEAGVKISMRLVANQDPDKIADLVERYVQQISPDTVQTKVVRHHGGWPYLARTDGPLVHAASAALQEVFGAAPKISREGGSIPIVVSLARTLGVDVLLMGFGYPDENSHAPDEHLPLDHFDRGSQAAALFYQNLSQSL